MSDSVRPHRWQPIRLCRPWDSPGKNTGVGCHFLLQCMKVKSKSEVAQSCPTFTTPWTAAHQAPPSMGFSRQEYWSGVSLPSPKGLHKHTQSDSRCCFHSWAYSREPEQKTVNVAEMDFDGVAGWEGGCLVWLIASYGVWNRWKLTRQLAKIMHL